MQTELFPCPLPSGITYQADFLSACQAAKLLETTGKPHWCDDLKRRVQQYGYRYNYKAHRTDRQDYLGPLPDWIQALLQQLVSEGHFPQVPNQVIVNEYLPGQGIAAHVDSVPCFGNRIASLSLGSGCMMRFEHCKTGQVLDHFLEPCSLLLMQGAGRYDWKHGIAARKSDVVGEVRQTRRRWVSLTFRRVIL